jgi:hypothetical protein
MSKTFPLSRRTALKGLGAALALPLLEAMLPERASGGTIKPPLRMAFIYVPNGVHIADWKPTREGPDFDLPAVLRPLQPLKEDVLVLSGLTLDAARPHGDGGGDHARAMASFLTGRHPRKTPGVDLRAGISVDQLAAQRVGGTTRFRSLEIGCEGGPRAGTCDNGYSCAYQTNLSWAGEATPMAKEIDPRLVFERLVGGPDKTDSTSSPAVRDRHRKSILDFVADDAGRLRVRLGSADRRKLDEYLTGVRAIEERLGRAQPAVKLGQIRLTRPAGVPANYQEYVRLMCDLLVLAFQADLTRIATFVFANDGSNRSYRSIGVPDGHHDLSHHGGDRVKQAKIRLINQFHVSQLAYLLGRLKAVPEGEGTLLDHSMIAYGSGIADGDRHNHDDLPILLAGRGNGTLKTGRHIRYLKETPLTNLYVAMLDRMGARVNGFGDSTGMLTGLEG